MRFLGVELVRLILRARWTAQRDRHARAASLQQRRAIASRSRAARLGSSQRLVVDEPVSRDKRKAPGLRTQLHSRDVQGHMRRTPVGRIGHKLVRSIRDKGAMHGLNTASSHEKNPTGRMDEQLNNLRN